MGQALKSPSYWLTLGVCVLLKFVSPSQEGTVWISVVCAGYFLGRGIANLPKIFGPEWKSPEFSVMLTFLGYFAHGFYAGDDSAFYGLIIAIFAYNLGIGMREYYRSKVTTVFNR